MLFLRLIYTPPDHLNWFAHKNSGVVWWITQFFSQLQKDRELLQWVCFWCKNQLNLETRNLHGVMNVGKLFFLFLLRTSLHESISVLSVKVKVSLKDMHLLFRWLHIIFNHVLKKVVLILISICAFRSWTLSSLYPLHKTSW